jgi:hypothetical protein
LKDGQTAVEATAGDVLSYRVLASSNGAYDLSVLCHGIRAGTVSVEVSVDGRAVGVCDVTAQLDTAVTSILRGISLTGGQHVLSLRVTEGTLRIESLTVRKGETVTPLTVTFDKDAENPIHGDGAWEIADGALALFGGSAYGKVLYGSPNWGDYEVEVTVTPKDSPNCGLLVRATNPGAPTFLNSWPSREDAVTATDWVMGYFVGLTENSVIIGKQSYSYTQLAKSNGHFAANQAYQLKVICKDASIQVFVDGQLYLDYTDPEPFFQGMVGLRTHNCSVAFDDLTVKEIQ